MTAVAGSKDCGRGVAGSDSRTQGAFRSRKRMHGEAIGSIARLSDPATPRPRDPATPRRVFK